MGTEQHTVFILGLITYPKVVISKLVIRPGYHVRLEKRKVSSL